MDKHKVASSRSDDKSELLAQILAGGAFSGETKSADQIRVRFTRFADGIDHVQSGEAHDLSLAEWATYRTRQASMNIPRQGKNQCPVEVGAVLRDGCRRDGSVAAMTWVFLDVDKAAPRWDELRGALDSLGAAYLLTESTSSGLPGKGRRWHCFLPLATPWCVGPGRGKPEWRSAYAHVCAVLARLGGIQEVDASVDDLSQPVFVARQPDGLAPRRVEWSEAGRALDLDALHAATKDAFPPDVPAGEAPPSSSPERPSIVAPGPTPGQTTGSLCKQAAEDLGLLGPAMGDSKWMVLCPWRHEHSPGCEQRDRDQHHSSTVIFLSGQNGEDGGFDCKHNHSDGEDAGRPKTAADFLSYARRQGVALPDRPGWVSESGTAAIDPDKERARLFGKVVDELNARHAVVRVGGRVRIVWTDDDALMSQDDFFRWYSNQKVTYTDEKGDTKATTKAAIWWNSSRRRQYAALAFRPDLDRAASEAEGIYNLWRGFAVERDPEGDCSLFLDHIRNNVCGGDAALYDWVLGWFAQMFQRPRERHGVALVLKSAGKGTGKSFVGEVFGHLLDKAYRSVSQAKHLTGNFNAHLEKTLFLLAEEAVWAGSRADQGVLQDLITNSSLTIERKGVDAYRAPNYVHLMLTSNGDWVVPASADERRWAVIEVSEGRKQDHSYFKDIHQQLEEAGGYGKLLDDLLSFDLSKIDLSKAPRTAALTEQKLASMRGIDGWLFRACNEGMIPGSRSAAGSAPGDIAWPEDTELCVERKVLNAAYKKHCEDQKEHPPNPISFSLQLGKMIRLVTSHRGVYWLPPLSEVRDVLSKKYGVTSATRSPPRVASPAGAEQLALPN